MLHRIFAVATVVIVALAMGTGVASATQPDPLHQVTICHRTHSATNPYVTITVDEASVDGVAGNDNGKGDHLLEHVGPTALTEAEFQAFKDAHTEWGDIIPPFYSDGETLTGYPTLNWDEVGQAVFANGCAPTTVEVPPTEVTAGVTFTNPTCKNPEASFTTKDVEGVSYRVSGVVAPGETMTVTAKADEGFVLVGKSVFTHTFGDVPTDCKTSTPTPTPTPSKPGKPNAPTPNNAGNTPRKTAFTGSQAATLGALAGVLALLGTGALFIARKRASTG